MKAISLFTDWHWVRWLRLVVGVYLLWQGVQMKDNFSLFIGSFFLIQAITNTGCCGAAGCSVPASKQVEQKPEDDDVHYTIVKP